MRDVPDRMAGRKHCLSTHRCRCRTSQGSRHWSQFAHDRYQLGLGSIVLMSEAQLQQANAAIQYVNVQYQYRLALSTLDFEIGAQPRLAKMYSASIVDSGAPRKCFILDGPL